MSKYVYAIQRGDSNQYKIGVSEQPIERMENLQHQNHMPLSLVFCRCTFMAYQVERALHKHFRKQRITGEWFSLTQEQVNGIGVLITKFQPRNSTPPALLIPKRPRSHKCRYCQQTIATIKTHRLCSPCYQFLRRKGKLNIRPYQRKSDNSS